MMSAMSFAEFIALFAIAFVFVVTPGPGTLAAFAKSMSQGFMPAFVLSMGMVLGDLVYLAAVIFSMDMFSNLVLSVMGYIRVLGGLYLIYLGVNTWRAPPVHLSTESRHKTNLKEFSTGFIISITNPKVMVFYIAILPALVDLENTTMSYSVQILVTFGLGLATGISLIAAGASRIKMWMSKPGADHRINQIVALVMISAGVLLGLS